MLKRIGLVKRYKFLKYIIYFLPLYFLSQLNFNLCAQDLKPSFTLDTAKTQVFPFDLEFNMKLVSPKDKPFKAIYLYRLNKKGKLVIDKNTSLKKFKWTPYYNEESIDKSISIETLEAKIFLKKYEDKKNIWREEYEKLKEKEIQLRALPHNRDAVEELEFLVKKIHTLKYQIDKYNQSDSLINYSLKKRKKLIADKKNASSILPLKEVNRIKDTLIVSIESLKPDKRYLLVALDYSNKIKVLAKLVEEYKKYSEFGKYVGSIVPRERVSKEQWKQLSEIVSPILLKQRIDTLSKLFKEYNKKPSLSLFEPNSDFPGGYTYPSYLIPSRPDNDSVYILPDSASQDFRELNAIMVTSKKYGNDLVTGKSKLELDKNNRINMVFEPAKDFDEQRTNITHHLNLATRAKQSLYLLESSDSIVSKYEDYLDDFVDFLEKNKLSIDENQKKKKEVDVELQKELLPIGQNLRTLEKTPHSYQFLTRNSGYIKPDFGLLYYHSDEGFQGFTPFAGFHFGRRRNEDVPFSQIPGFGKYISFQIGVPFFTENLIEDGRRKHLIGDTFSLYGGVGINFNHAIRITYGGILFRGIDSNSVGEGTFKIKTVQSLALSINLKLQSLFEGLYGSINSLNPTK